MSSFHLEAIGEEQRTVARRIGPVAEARGFHLAGGTAVALHLGHRRSVDLDFFTEEAFDVPLELAETLRRQDKSFASESVAPGTLHGTAEGVRVSFLEYRYPLLRPPVPWPEAGCALAALDDLAAMKLAAVAQRGAKKDFFDLHALTQAHRPLAELLPLYREKYEASDLAHVFYALTYFDDADAQPTPALLGDVTWPDVKEAVRAGVRELAA
jgi:hypothetical protein